MIRLLFACIALTCWGQIGPAQGLSVQQILQQNKTLVETASRKTIGPVIDAIAVSNLPQAQGFLEAWGRKAIWQRRSDGLFFIGTEVAKRQYALRDPDSGDGVGDFAKADLKQLKPNSGVRALIATALVQFQLSDADPAKRAEALLAIERAPSGDHLTPLRASLADEPDAVLKARKSRLERLLTIAFDPDPATRVAAIQSFDGDLGVDLRATLNPLVVRTLNATAGELPKGVNIARILTPGGEDLDRTRAYDLLIEAKLAAAPTTPSDIRAALVEHFDTGFVAQIAIDQLADPGLRRRAYDRLAAQSLVPVFIGDDDITRSLNTYIFYEVFSEASATVTTAAELALADIALKVGMNQALDLGLDAVSLASIYFLAAIGLAITFGVMGVINMAHGEFIMMGAYTGYVVQQVIPNHTASILVALPLAFAVTFAAGVAMERLVIRYLYNRPLETLLATFGISIALQQLAKNIFGTQARPLTAPSWLDGAWVMNDVVSISYIRIAIFILAMLFLGVFLFIMKRTRLGLETRTVTQNPRMAASMGINPERVNMLTFGLGSGIAGVAGVAIGLFAKVTSELGNDYIVQSFMTVVVGGVGNIWGALAGATMIGFLQKGIEWGNPSNTLAAQTYMIIFIIIFIQFRPRGIIALKGRAAGD
ncbi:urea ABC transporter permease subunit UrtB [Parasedimentitalea marina]|uniref:Urea ABC transporter permease subunit UrtB n=1 Tax=Parasedimentitalea marina TaxID=2483033 RepID=A0A3T0MZS7_9RHOB|nr:urea ABC transporter permease subunit UrtB [Parasedimentitalea marina]AZV77257.1 urea ABC transporter permease subunit UrtB [Parasedimentitalea marina]